MSFKIIMSLVLLSSWAAQARISVSKEYRLSPAGLAEIDSKIKKAQGRDEEMQNYMAYYSLQSFEKVSLGCGPHLPDKDGKGCSLTFMFGDGGGPSISLSKRVLLSGKSKEVEMALAKVDANATQDHQHFGSIFEPADSYASHYFCQPEGEEGKKLWECYLHVHESVN